MCRFVHVGVGVADAWDARCLGLENKKGTLRPGADADPIVLDEDEEKARVVSTAGVDAEDANVSLFIALLAVGDDNGPGCVAHADWL